MLLTFQIACLRYSLISNRIHDSSCLPHRGHRGWNCIPHALRMESAVICFATFALTLHKKMENTVGWWDQIPAVRVSFGALGLMISMVVPRLIFVPPHFQVRLYWRSQSRQLFISFLADDRYIHWAESMQGLGWMLFRASPLIYLFWIQEGRMVGVVLQLFEAFFYNKGYLSTFHRMVYPGWYTRTT